MKSFKTILKITLLIMLSITTQAKNKIIGGQRTSNQNHPWQVSLQRSFTGHFCGGSLIQENIVLTAAHCVDDIKAREIRIKGGSTDGRLKSLKTIARVKKIILHPDYEKGILAPHDIALLILRRQVKLSQNIKLIKLPIDLFNIEKTFKEIPGRLMATGWGDTTSPDPIIAVSEQLFELQLKAVGVSNVDGAFNEFRDTLFWGYYFDDDMIDYIYDNGSKVLMTGGMTPKTGVCMGDSGGPLVLFNNKNTPTLIGVSSYTAGGIKICEGISGFTNVQAYLEWITKNAQRNSFSSLF